MHPHHTQNSFLPRQTAPFDAAAELKRATSTGLPPIGAKAQSQKSSTASATRRSRTTQVVDAYSSEPKRDPFLSQAGQPAPSSSRPPRKLTKAARRMTEGKPFDQRIVKPLQRGCHSYPLSIAQPPSHLVFIAQQRQGLLMREEQEAPARRDAISKDENYLEEDK